jgi:hypothetical protein
MSLKRIMMLLLFAAFACNSLWAQTVTVGTSGDYTTLQAAINSFRTATAGVNASDPADNVIQLLDNFTTEPTRVYISQDITSNSTTNGIVIKSLAPQGYTVLQINADVTVTSDSGLANDALVSIYNEKRVEIEGLHIVPKSNTTRRGITIDDNNVNSIKSSLTILKNIWLMPRQGADTASNGFTAPPATPDAQLQGEGINVQSFGTNGVGTVQMSDVRLTGIGGKALRVFNQNVQMGPGCMVTYCAATAALEVNQTTANAGLSILGSETNPIWFALNTGIGMDIATGASAVGINLSGAWIRCIGNGSGYDQSAGALTSITHSIFALNGGANGNFYFYSTQDTTPNVIQECTFYGAVTANAPAFSLSGAGKSAWTIEGSVFAATGTSTDDLLFNGTTGTSSTVTVRNSALVTQGANALSTADSDGIRDADITRFVLQDNVNADPAFESVDPYAANFLYVNNVAVYTAAGISAGILRGGTNQVTVPVELSAFSLE